ncbi:hypothetical protein B0J18DRAFT_418741 [Chaetomium sp. MPI-SDFR-AT-0129]|nr:hypothetical protein B0J18DRAFT_418741 [Chaetomium sp. MPI-SDFR-AT-0129]
MAVHSQERPFIRPKFSALPKSPGSDAKGDAGEQPHEIESLLDLIAFNVEHNPNHMFCVQASLPKDHDATDDNNDSKNPGQVPFDGRSITFRELGVAVVACASWLSGLGLRRVDDQGRPKPLALYLQSDVGLFILLSALLSLDVPVLLLSARLAPPSVQHLLEKTGCDTVLVSTRTRLALAGSLSDHGGPIRLLQTVEPYTAFLNHDVTSHNGTPNNKIATTFPQKNLTNSSLILHSSGTTGLPKPIVLSPRYPLLYASCHELPDDDEQQPTAWTNLSTLPLYHGFGLLAPCLSLSVGMACCFPPSSIIPAGFSTMALLEAFDCRSLMTVPSIVGELLDMLPATNVADGNGNGSSNGTSSPLRRLRALEFLAVGGGALAPDRREALHNAGIRLINHYGVTEIGPLAPIFLPRAEEYHNNNWRFIRLRSDLDLQLLPAPGSPGRWRLVGWPVGWGGKMFEIQDDLERNPNSNLDPDPDAPRSGHVQVRILGRTDDVIVLKTGEKVLPQQLEAALHAQPFVQTAVCLGQGQFEVAVLIEPRHGAGVEVDNNNNEGSFVNDIWEFVETRVNPMLDRHARLASKAAIIIKPPHKPIPRTDKGSVNRKMVHDVFADELQVAYAAMENETAGDGLGFVSAAEGDIVSGLRKMVLHVLAIGSDHDNDHRHIDTEQDLFEWGMDSLQALRLARQVRSSITSLLSDLGPAPAPGGRVFSAEFIYRNPSITKLTRAVQQQLLPGSLVPEDTTRGRDSDTEQARSSQMRSLAATFTARMQAPRLVVLLTGATGTLGVNVFASLAKRTDVSKVIIVGRKSRSSATTADANEPTKESSANSVVIRLRAALSTAGISLKDDQWSKVEAVEDSELLQPTAAPATLSRVAAQVTHVVHMAWPMDFRRNLASFDPHFQMLTALLEIGRSAHAMSAGRRRVRLIFVSSIATVEHFAGGPNVPERIMDDPATAAPMGYAEAKWVCEHIMSSAADAWRSEMEPVIVRVGQLTGAEQNHGLWKTAEHIPALIKASRRIGAFPSLQGTVSWIPVDRAAQALVDIVCYRNELKTAVLHLENPVRQPANDVMAIVAYELGLRGPHSFVPYAEWLKRARSIGSVDSADNSGVGSLQDFFEHHFQRLALGNVILDTSESRRVSETLRRSSGVGKSLIVKYVRDWIGSNFLDE